MDLQNESPFTQLLAGILLSAFDRQRAAADARDTTRADYCSDCRYYARIHGQLCKCVNSSCPSNRVRKPATVAGIGPGRWDNSALARNQERAAVRSSATSRVYTIYTETVADVDLAPIIGRYFPGYTVTYGTGVYEGTSEPCTVVTVVGTERDIQRAVDLAGDIRVIGQQSSVLLTWTPCGRIDINAAALNEAAL